MATATGAYDIPGSPQSRRMVILIGWFIGLSWLGIYLAGDAAGRDLALEFGLRPFGRGFHPVQLLTHSLVHEGFTLVLDLPLLPFVIYLSRNRLTPVALMRVYSMGVFCGALLFLLGTFLASQVHERDILTGGVFVHYAIFGAALVNPNPQADKLLDSSFYSLPAGERLKRLLMLLPVLVPVFMSGLAFAFMGFLGCLMFLIGILNLDVRDGAMFMFIGLVILSAFGIGLVYGLVEKRKRRKAGASGKTE